MKFDVYFSHKDKNGHYVPGTKPIQKEWSEVKTIIGQKWLKELLDSMRSMSDEDYKQAKKQLPAICWTGYCDGSRKLEACVPTQLVMVDIDHCEDPFKLWSVIRQRIIEDEDRVNVLLSHVTPSGKGLRIIFEGRAGMKTLQENLEWFKERYYKDEDGGSYDILKDYTRLSFLVYEDDFLYISTVLESSDFKPQNKDMENKLGESSAKTLFDEVEKPQMFSDEEKERFDSFEYRGTPVKIIVEKYVEVFGTPSSGEIHNYYNEMVKNFRCITDNNKRLLLYLLPKFGHSEEECWSQIKSICRVNTLSSLPKKFYFFLKDNGYYQSSQIKQGALHDYMMCEKEEVKTLPPYLPPVFREIVKTAPADFVVPCVNALLPIIGTLTSYVQARYPYDDRMHTTSFFSVIYAPPGTGKGFVERFMDLMFEDLKERDMIQSMRENIFLRTMQRKGANDKAPDIPHTSLRLIPPKNSEAEFLQKQSDNHGYHMFTYAAEMDSWAKGVKAAGGNKDDMIRIAWDNGEYGQQFKSFNTFKGVVRLFWNVLITGTLQQVESYFKNVENGLVTRCSFSSIDNQEFSNAPKWKILSEKSKRNIRKFLDRCDRNTYEEPLSVNPSDLIGINDDDFDKEVDWKFKFRERQTVDCSWIMPTIDDFHQEQMKQAALDVDKARDVFRRRVGVRGFRLALMCMCLWDKPKKKDLDNCKEFIKWWMNEDLKNMMRLWGERYNEQSDTTPKLVQRTVFNELPKVFSRNDVYVVCMKQGIKTPIRRILFDWKKLKYIEQHDKDTFEKK